MDGSTCMVREVGKVLLRSVEVQGFRSIEKAAIERCGRFNVLIGKNNSGKSNLLQAVSRFHEVMSAGEVVQIVPNSALDFFQRDMTKPIEITEVFSLLLSERDALLRNIIDEAPQVRNTIEGIGPDVLLAITIRILGSSNLQYVSNIILVEPPSSGDGDHRERTILEMSDDAATEISQHLIARNELEKDRRWLVSFRETFDAGDWAVVREQPELIRARHYRLRLPSAQGRRPSRELEETTYTFIEKSTSYEDFRNRVDGLVVDLAERGDEIRGKPLRHYVDTFSGEESSIPKYVSSLLAAVGEMKVLHLREQRRPIGRDEAETLLQYKITRGGEAVLSSLKTKVRDLLGVTIDAFEQRTGGERVAEMDVDDFLVEANGSGVREALRLALDVELQQPKLVLVEEPEVHLHPALERSMMQYLKETSKEAQVFITTHSSNFLDTTDMKNVYLVTKNGSTDVRLLAHQEIEAEIPEELGLSLSSLFLYDRLVFVEGVTDEAVIRALASTLGINLGISNVGFIPMGGARNFSLFASETTLSFLTQRNVALWFIVDRDERDEPEIERLESVLHGKAQLDILQKREIENYLAQPRALSAFIARKREMAGVSNGAPSPAEVEKQIEEAAERLKPFTIRKWAEKTLCRPVYPDSAILDESVQKTDALVSTIAEVLEDMINEVAAARDKVTEVWEEQEAQIETLWPTRKLDLVPGEELLDRVCREYGVRFHKRADSVRLAELLEPDEIDLELRSIIERVSSSSDDEPFAL